MATGPDAKERKKMEEVALAPQTPVQSGSDDTSGTEDSRHSSDAVLECVDSDINRSHNNNNNNDNSSSDNKNNNNNNNNTSNETEQHASNSPRGEVTLKLADEGSTGDDCSSSSPALAADGLDEKVPSASRLVSGDTSATLLDREDEEVHQAGRLISTGTAATNDDQTDSEEADFCGCDSVESQQQQHQHQSASEVESEPPSSFIVASSEEISAAMEAVRNQVQATQATKAEAEAEAEVSDPNSNIIVDLGASSGTVGTEDAVEEKNMYDSDSEEEAERQRKKASAQQRGRINFVRLKQLLQAAQATLVKIDGKNILLVLGRTGVGKSTFIQRVSGRTLRRSTYAEEVEGWDGEALKEVFDVVGEPLEGFEIGHESQSKTQSINHLIMKSLRADDEVAYVDSAGFEDTTGPEADIATSLSVTRVAETCRGLRFIVLVSCTSFVDARGGGLRSLVELVKSFVTGWKKQRLAFTFLFTHTDALLPKAKQSESSGGDFCCDMRQVLRNHLWELGSNTIDESQKGILDWLVKCMDKGWYRFVDVFHPLDSDVDSLRDGIEKFEIEVEGKGKVYPAIGLTPDERCSDVIQCGLTSESTNKIGVELRFLLTGVSEWLQGNNFDRLAENMETLAYLREQMDDVDQVRDGAQKIANKIKGESYRRVQEAYTVINSCTEWPPTSSLHLSVETATKVLLDLASADGFYNLPLSKINPDITPSSVEGMAVKVVLHLIEKLKDLHDRLLGSPLNPASSSMMTTPATTAATTATATPPSTAAAAAATATISLLKPLPEGTFEGIGHLLCWAEGAKRSGFELPALARAAESGTQLLSGYADKLIDLVRNLNEGEMDFDYLCERMVSGLARLECLGQGLASLSDFDIQVEDNFKTEAEALAPRLKELAESLANESLKSLDSGLAVFRSHAENLPTLAKHAEMEAAFSDTSAAVTKLLQLAACVKREQGVLYSLDDDIQRGLSSVEKQAEQFVRSLDNETGPALLKTPEQGPLPDSVLVLADLLQSLSKALQGPEGGQHLRAHANCQAALKRYCSMITEHVKRWEAQLDMLWREGQRKTDPEFRVGEQVTLLTSLEQTTWHDRFQSTSETTSRTTFRDAIDSQRSKYTKYIRDQSSKVEKSLDAFLSDPFSSVKRSNFVTALKARLKLQAFSQVCPEITDDFDNLTETNLGELLATWKEEQLQIPMESLTKVLAPHANFAKELEIVLRVCEASQDIPGAPERLKTLKATADDRLVWLREEVSKLVAGSGDFESKKQLLDALTTWKSPEGQSNKDQKASLKFEHISAALPSLEVLVEDMREAVTKEGTRIQEQLVAEGKLDEAEECVQALEGALCLDPYLRGMAKNVLDTVKQRMEISRADFDNAFKGQIEACDFDGLKGRFEEMANVKTKTGKEKAKEMWNIISASVEAESSRAEANIRDGEKVAGSIEKLERALIELQPFLAKFKTLNIEKIVSSLKQHVENAFAGILEDFKSALSASKLPEVVEHQHSLVKYHRHTKRWLSDAAHQEAVKALDTAAKCPGSIENLVNRFVKNLGLKPEDRTDTSELIAELNQLKHLTDSAAVCSSDADALIGGHISSPDADVFRPQWVVIGAVSEGGAKVRSGESLKSSEESCLLERAAIVEELERGSENNNRIKYNLVQGKGPQSGWISILVKECENICPVSAVRVVCAPKSVATQKGKDYSSKQDRLDPGALVRVIGEEGDRINFLKLSNHNGPQQGWADKTTNSNQNFREVVQQTYVRNDLRASISLHAVATSYKRAVQNLSAKLTKFRDENPMSAGDPAVLTRARSVYKYLISECRKGLGDHLQLEFKLEEKLEEAEKEHNLRYADLHSPFTSVEQMEEVLSVLLGKWAGVTGHLLTWYDREAYNNDQRQVTVQAQATVKSAVEALGAYDYVRCGIQCRIALAMEEPLNRHTQTRAAFTNEISKLNRQVRSHFEGVSKDLLQALGTHNISEFEQLLFRHYKLVKHLRVPYPGLLNNLTSMHEQIANYTEDRVKEVQAAAKSFTLAKVKQCIDSMRKFGQVLSGVYALYAEMIRDRPDAAIDRLNRLCSEHFGGKELVHLGRFYAVLEIPPNANQEDIDRAFRNRSRECHPDKCRSADDAAATEEQKQLNEAKSQLSDARIREAYQRSLRDPFANLLREIPVQMRSTVVDCLKNSDYQTAKDVMVSARDLGLISQLVDPNLNAEECKERVRQTIKEHFDELSNKVSTFWLNQKLKELNLVLERMEKVDLSFSAHTDVYSSEWNKRLRTDVARSIKTKADKLWQTMDRMARGGQEVSQMLQMADGLLALGRLMDEIPLFKADASTNIEHILDHCQEELGPNFIFKLGMLLEQGKVGKKDSDGNITAADKRVARVILNTFRQFRDILTVIWNQQTSITQKDLPSTLREIKSMKVSASGQQSPMGVNTQRLQQGVDKYDELYKNFMQEWKAGMKNCQDLVTDVKATARKAVPCRVHFWGPHVKELLPELLAGIAAYFTISKSGDSFRRLTKAGTGGQHVAVTSARGAPNEAINADTILQKPHTIQVLTLLRLFGYDSDGQSLIRQLMQIRTGEGKSMILGMSSLLFALLGFPVRCICYSEYLSQRDFKLFEEMFEDFGVKSLVTYSKITTFSEDKVATQGDIRQLTVDMLKGTLKPTVSVGVTSPVSGSPASSFPAISGGSNPGSESRSIASPATTSMPTSTSTTTTTTVTVPSACMGASGTVTMSAPTTSTLRTVGQLQHGAASLGASNQPEEILLLDEVDMFFGADFYGRTHDQVAVLESSEVSDILKMIWKNRSLARSQLLQQVKASPQYQGLLRALRGFDFVVDREVTQMCDDVREFQTPPYHCDSGNNRIGYKELDGVCYDIVYGYRTAFAYLHEADNKNFQNSQKALTTGLRMRVSCGQFCYNKINPACILGMSGTLDALGGEEWKIIVKYQIDCYSIMPSVYGKSNFKWWNQEGVDPVTVVETRAEHFAAITEIVKRMLEDKRAAIVLFETAELLKEFEKSEYFQKVSQKNVLSESKSHEDKDYVIKKAATAGQATFTTAVFGRGTDFMCNDQRLLDAGGVHIIQAFFSADKSEEVQIQGRTARQGKKGTYCMILCEPDLHKLFGSKRRIAGQMAPKDLYNNYLEIERAKLQHQKHQTIEKSLAGAEERDGMTRQYFQALLAGSLVMSQQYFKDLYNKIWAAVRQGRSGGGGGPLHVVFCLDGSGSMGGSPWRDLMQAFTTFLNTRRGNPDKVSVVIFDDFSQVAMSMVELNSALSSWLSMPGGGTCFLPALRDAQQLLSLGSQEKLAPVLIFMSDGANGDGDCLSEMQHLHQQHPDLQCHTIFFGRGGSERLRLMAEAVPDGQYHHSVDGIALQETFKSIAVGAEYTK